MKYLFCPEGCVYDPEIQAFIPICAGCIHALDVVVNPPRAGKLNGKPVEVVGFTGDKAYVEKEMSGGGKSRFSTDRDNVQYDQ